MTTYVVPLNPVPAQIESLNLGGQRCTIVVRQRTIGMFIDVYISDTLIIGGVLCRHNTKIVRDAYLGFIGELVFFDTEGTSDPMYDGLGTRWKLYYIN